MQSFSWFFNQMDIKQIYILSPEPHMAENISLRSVTMEMTICFWNMCEILVCIFTIFAVRVHCVLLLQQNFIESVPFSLKG